MKLFIDDHIKVEGTIEELLDFLKGYTNQLKETVKPITVSPTFRKDLDNCEGCSIYERIKKGETIIDDSCYWCPKNPYKVTCTSQNTVKTQLL